MSEVTVTYELKCKICGVVDKKEVSQYFKTYKFKPVSELDPDELDWRIMWAAFFLYYGPDPFL